MKPNVVATFTGLMVIAVAACAQDYPNRPIRIITSPAGGGNDVPARLLAQGIAGSLGQQVVVDNRPTVLIAELVAKAPPDGYTILFSGGPHWLGHFFEKTSYDPVKDFAPVSIVDRQPVILVVHPSMPIKAGRLRALAVGSAEPTALAPGIPTIAAMGVPGYESDALHAVFAPVKTPASIVDRLSQEIARYLKTADAKEKFLNTVAEPVSSSPDGLAATMKSEMARIAKVVKAAGITPP